VFNDAEFGFLTISTEQMWFLGKLNNIFCTDSKSDDTTSIYVHVMYV